MAKNRTLGLKLRAIDRMSSVIDKISKKFPKLTRSIQKGARVSKIFNAQTKGMRAGLLKVGNGMKSFGKGMIIGVTLPVLAAGAAGAKMFASYEQGLRGIEKTTGIARPEVAKLGDRFRQLSTEIPVTVANMQELAQAGGQLGIKGVKDLEKFTITMAKLGESSDVVGEEGAKSIARILTVTGDGIGKIDRFSSALVDLGNNAEASESEILGIATRIAGQIGRFDVASDKVLGMSTALKSLGKNAESSGSVVGRAFDAIDQSIKGGGKQMQFLSKLTGIAAKDLKKSFEKDAAGVFQKFVIGLNKVGKSGGNQIKVLGALGLKGVRINDILLTLAKRPEVLAKNMDRASEAFAKNTALQKEFEVQTDSFGSSMKKIFNTFTDLLTLVGEDLAPAIEFFGGIFKWMLDILRNNPVLRTTLLIFAGLAAVAGPLLVIFGGFLTLLPAMITGWAALSTASLPITGTMLAIAAAIGVLIFLGVLFVKKWESIKEFFNENPFGQALKFVLLFLNPIGLAITGIRTLIASFKSLSAAKNVLRGALPKFLGDKIFGKQLGPDSAAGAKNKGIANAGGGAQDNFNGVLDVNFRNAPAGTNVKAKAQGPLDFNLGFAGGFQ